jgi:hypothetical protein
MEPVSVSRSDFEGRFYWIEETVGQARIRGHASFTVRLPPPFDKHPTEVTAKMWQEAMRTRNLRPRRRLATPSSFFQPLDDATVSSSSTSTSLFSSTGIIAVPPPRTQSPLFLYPECGLERWLSTVPAPDTSIDEMQRALLDYARLLADTRWPKAADWNTLRAAYPRLLGEKNLRVHALLVVLRFMVVPSPWIWSGRAEEETTLITGVDEWYPPLLSALFRAEETIVAAQCRAEAVTADGALACLRVAQQFQSQSLGVPHLTETSMGARPRFGLDLETRLLSGLGIGDDEVDATVLCRHLLPRLHGRALKADVLTWLHDFAKQAPPSFSHEKDLLREMHPMKAVYWAMTREARPFIADALLLPSPGDFFLGSGKRLGPSAFPARVSDHLRDGAVDHTGKWRAPRDKAERVQRLNALGVDMEDLFRTAPPCMAAALNKARTQRKLKNDDRYPLSTWFSALFPSTDATDVARALFGGHLGDTPGEQDITRAITDAQNTPWAPFHCNEIIERSCAKDAVIVCPYADRAKCAACYASEKKLPLVPPPLETPVDYLLFYNGR